MMRRSLALPLALFFFAPAAAYGDTPTLSPPLQAEEAQTGRAKLRVTIDRAKVDIDNRRLEVKMSRPADKVRIKVLDESGNTLADQEKSFGGAAPGTPLVVTWTPSSKAAVGRIEVYGYDTRGFWAGVAITPWNVRIAHEEVNFKTDSAVIRASEVPKLQASLRKIADALASHKELGKITLYIVGHTDTVGSTEHNLNLSRRRARAIAAWFKSKGLRNPVAYEGLGESSPLVKTADEVDEPKNRRVDYILSVEPPRLPRTEFSWKAL